MPQGVSLLDDTVWLMLKSLVRFRVTVPPPRTALPFAFFPLVGTSISTSETGMSFNFSRKSFSKVLAIKTTSSVGCKATIEIGVIFFLLLLTWVCTDGNSFMGVHTGYNSFAVVIPQTLQFYAGSH